jgi:hypothetical protein
LFDLLFGSSLSVPSSFLTLLFFLFAQDMESAQFNAQSNIDKMDITEDQAPSIHDFLSRHIPPQVTNTRKLCYRHRPDLIKKRMPDAFDFSLVQKVSLYRLEINRITNKLALDLSISKWRNLVRTIEQPSLIYGPYSQQPPPINECLS